MKQNWITDLDGAFDRCGDLPEIRSLPHMGARAAEFAARAVTPDGRPARIAPSRIGRLLARFTKTPEDEVEKLRRMLAEVNAS